MVYVLLNFRKHLRAAVAVDPCSSGPWFDGWVRPVARASVPPPVAAPRTWLATAGWRRGGGAIDWREGPAAGQPGGRGRGALAKEPSTGVNPPGRGLPLSRPSRSFP